MAISWPSGQVLVVSTLVVVVAKTGKTPPDCKPLPVSKIVGLRTTLCCARHSPDSNFQPISSGCGALRIS